MRLNVTAKSKSVVDASYSLVVHLSIAVIKLTVRFECGNLVNVRQQ